MYITFDNVYVNTSMFIRQPVCCSVISAVLNVISDETDIA